MNFRKELHAELEDSVQAGIITPEQLAAIEARAQQRRGAGRVKGVTWIAAMAGLCFALGLILVISHNWDKIPETAKILSFILILLGAGETALRLDASKPTAATGVAALWFFLPIAGIGLYAQVFQLSGDAIKPYLIWAALSAPLAFLWRDRKISYLELLLLAPVLWIGNFAADGLMRLADGGLWYGNGQAAAPAAWLVSLAVLGAMAALVFTKLPKAKLFFTAFFCGWLIALSAMTKFFRCHDPWLLMLGASGAALACLLVNSFDEEGEQSSAPFWLWVAIPYVISFLYKSGRNLTYTRDLDANGVVLLTGLYAVSAAAFWLNKRRIFSQDPDHETAAKAAALAISLLPLAGLFGNSMSAGMAANILLFLTAAALMWHGTVSGSVGNINRGVRLLILMMATRFLDLFVSLLRSGAAFMAAGLLLAALAYAIHKGRKTLIEKAGGAS